MKLNRAKLYAIVFVVAGLFFAGSVTKAKFDEKGLVTIKVQDPSKTRQELESHHSNLDVLGINKVKGTVNFYGGAETMSLLMSLGYNPSYAALPIKKVVAENEAYKKLPEVEADLRALAEKYPQNVKLISLMQEFGIEKTAQGKEIFALRLSSDSSRRQDKPRIAFIGNHHAREIQTPEAVLDTAHWILENAKSDPRAADWLSSYEIWIVPVVNPDGYDYVFNGDPMWRKNRSNTVGVDLNRNYPFHWGGCGNNSTSPDSEVYIGPSATSEPEVRAMIALSQRENFWISISYHSFGEEVLFPYLCAKFPQGEVAIRDQIVDEYRGAMNFGKRNASSEGEDFEWRFNQVGGIAFLVEVSQDFQPDYASFVSNELPHIRDGWFYLMNRIKGPVLTGRVTDATTGKALSANIQIVEIGYLESEKRVSDPDSGRYFWFLTPGKYSLRVSSAGYQTVTTPVEVSAKGPSIVDVKLQR